MLSLNFSKKREEGEIRIRSDQKIKNQQSNILYALLKFTAPEVMLPKFNSMKFKNSDWRTLMTISRNRQADDGSGNFIQILLRFLINLR